jgi:hypothetical protein
MFRSTTVIRDLAYSLAKVIFILKHSVKYVFIHYVIMWHHHINITFARLYASSLMTVVDRNM